MLFILLIIIIFLFITQLYYISGYLKVCEHQNSYVKIWFLTVFISILIKFSFIFT